MNELELWINLMQSGNVTHIRPRKWCGRWLLYAYNRKLIIPMVGSIADSPEAYQAARNANISIEDLL